MKNTIPPGYFWETLINVTQDNTLLLLNIDHNINVIREKKEAVREEIRLNDVISYELRGFLLGFPCTVDGTRICGEPPLPPSEGKAAIPQYGRIVIY
jgi:hypothetical protein